MRSRTNLYCGCSTTKKETNSTTFYLTCDHFRDMVQPILTLKLGFFLQMTHVKCANDFVHSYNIAHCTIKIFPLSHHIEKLKIFAFEAWITPSQLRFQRVQLQILQPDQQPLTCSSFKRTIPQSWRRPHSPRLPYQSVLHIHCLPSYIMN